MNLVRLSLKELSIKTKIKKEWTYFLATIREFMGQSNFWRYYALAFGLYGLGYFALLRADIYFIDDLRRSVDGVFGFEFFSRYGSELLSMPLHASRKFNTDISPIPQIIAIALLSLSSMIFAKIVARKIGVVSILASLPIGLSPFFLENMSYKFDSPFMALALLAGFVPFLFIKRKLLFCIVFTICMMITMLTYQAGNAIYLVLMMFFIFTETLQNKNPLKKIIFFALLFCGSILLCKILFIKSVDAGYVSTNLAGFENIFDTIFERIKLSLVHYKTFLLFSFLKILLPLSIMLFILTGIKLAKANKLLALIYSTLFIILSISLSFSIFLALKSVWMTPRLY